MTLNLADTMKSVAEETRAGLGGFVRVFGDVTGTNFVFGHLANAIDGTVNGVEKDLSGAWDDAVFNEVGRQFGTGIQNMVLEGMKTGKWLAADIESEMKEQALNNYLQGMSRHEAQKSVIDSIKSREKTLMTSVAPASLVTYPNVAPQPPPV